MDADSLAEMIKNDIDKEIKSMISEQKNDVGGTGDIGGRTVLPPIKAVVGGGGGVGHQSMRR